MKIRTLIQLGAVSGMVGMPIASSAKDDPAESSVDVSALTMSGFVGEATVDAESLAGKVVAVEYWGQH